MNNTYEIGNLTRVLKSIELINVFLNLFQYGEQIIYLTSDDSNAQHCRNNGSVITLEMGQRSAVVIRLGRIQHHMDPFLCTLQIKKGKRYVAFHSINNLGLIALRKLEKSLPLNTWGISCSQLELWKFSTQKAHQFLNANII